MLDPGATLPTVGRPGDAGRDLACCELTIFHQNQRRTIDTGVHVAIPPGHCGLILGRSGLGSLGLFVFPGLIDENYRGSICVVAWNTSEKKHVFSSGDRIAQLLVARYADLAPMVVDSLGDTARGGKGFGSSDARETSDLATGTGHSRHLNGHPKATGGQE
jgi:dUTP pyrophosphatase